MSRRKRPEWHIWIPPTEASLTGVIPGLRGREAVQAVIAKLLGTR